MTTYYLYVTFMGFELFKSQSDDLEEILNSGEVEEFYDQTWQPMEAFLDDEDGINQTVEIYSRKTLLEPSAEWMAKEGHKVVSCECSMTYELETDTTPQIEDFSFDGPSAFYKGKDMEMIDGEGIYYVEVVK